MLSYVLKRLLYFIPGLFLLTTVGFYICANVNEDPVSTKLGDNESDNPQQVQYLREKWHFDKPLFYFSLSAFSEPDTLYKIYNRFEKSAASRILAETGNWEKIEIYRKKIFEWKKLHKSAQKDSLLQNDSLYNIVYTYSAEQSQQLLQRFDKMEIKTIFDSLAQIYPKSRQAKPILVAFQAVQSAYKDIYATPTTYRNYIPKISFNGFQNRYHLWLMGIFAGDWGASYETQMPVLEQIKSYLPSSLLISILSFFVIILAGISLGMMMAMQHQKRWSKSVLMILFMLDALPNFWIAIMLLFLFANPDILAIFPPHFDYSFMGLVLPVLAYSFGRIVHLALFIYQITLGLFESEFIRTARAKGLAESRILFTHVLKNAILPIIPLLSGFPAALISGSVIMEYIFSVGGMGEQILTAIRQNDMPMVMAIFTITGFLTMLGFLLSDILLAILDPRISKNFVASNAAS